MDKADAFTAFPSDISPIVPNDHDANIIKKLSDEVVELKKELSIERLLRYEAERKAEKLQELIISGNETRKRSATRKSQTSAVREYSEFKSDGIRKARPADSIRSYEDFVAIQNYFLHRNKIRDWMMWTIGVSLGLRISDLLSLKIRFLLNNDRTFRKRIFIIEEKTSKLNNCLITEAVVSAVTKYFDSIDWNFSLDDYLFKSNKTKGKMYEEYGWKILSDAGKSLALPIVIGSHTMRKSFANIAACADKAVIDMNAITKIQGLLNHSDQRVTKRYLGSFQDMYDRARTAVSDFVLGKTNIHELTVGNKFSIDDIISKLDQIETVLLSNR